MYTPRRFESTHGFFQGATPHGTHHTTHGDRDRERRQREKRDDEREDKTRQDKMKVS